MNITIEMIPKLEKAFGIKLYESQVQALINDDYNLFNGRRYGKTFVYMIKLALSEGKSIRIDKLSYYSDRDIREKSYSLWFQNEFIEIRDTLRDNGFIVRDVYYK